MNLKDYNFREPPFQHQLDWLERYSLEPYHAMFHGMGTGKTMIAIVNAAILYSAGEIDGLFVVTLNGVHENWALRELPRHLPTHIQCEIHAWTSHALKKVKEKRTRLLKPSSKLRVLCMNVEALSGETGLKYGAAFIKSCQKRVMFVVDEATVIKNPKSKRSKNVRMLAKHCRYRRVMTGSPITETPFNIWAQTEVLQPSLLGFKNYFLFTHHYGVYKKVYLGPNRPSFEEVTGYQHVDELVDRLKEFSTFIKKEDCHDLPPKIYERRYVELTASQVTAYNTMAKELLVFCDQGLITATNALHKLLRLHQITLGYLTTDDGKLIRLEHNRIKVLLELLEEVSGSVIIWSTRIDALNEVVEALMKTYGDASVVEYHGSVIPEARNMAIERFQAGDTRFFVGNPQTAGYGLTLTKATTVIYYANGYSLEQRLQSEDRAHRVGQEHAVTYVDLVSPGTVDERVLNSLMNKINVENQITNMLKGWLN